MIKQPKQPKTSKQSTSGSASSSPIRHLVHDEDVWRQDPDCLDSLKTLICVECGRSQPNTLRMHQHLQMHRQAKTKSKTPISASVVASLTPPKGKPVEKS